MYQKTNQQDPPYTDHQRDDYMLLKDLFASALVRVGVTINKKIDLSICPYNPVEINNNIGSGTSAKYYSTQLSVAYKFGK